MVDTIRSCDYNKSETKCEKNCEWKLDITNGKYYSKYKYCKVNKTDSIEILTNSWRRR